MTWYDWITSEYSNEFKNLFNIVKITPYNIPNDANNNNTKIVTEKPSKKEQNFKYIKYENEYYEWYDTKYILYTNSYFCIDNMISYPVFCDNNKGSYICRKDCLPVHYKQMINENGVYKISTDNNFVSYDY
jgi:hypothetical protein